jgi:penicillin-binding protein 1A
VTFLSRFVRLVLLLAAISGVMVASLAFVAPRVVDLVSAHRSDHEQLTLDPLAERSYIFDRRGNLQGTLINGLNENRVQVDLEDVPETIIGAVLAAEDENFYDHKGVNLRSIGRAVDANLESGSASQGGSTITQQVVKNSLVGDDQDLSRKIREAFLAVELEKQLKEENCPKPVQADCTAGKDAILERYLNSVYFGGGSYGVQAASEYYFNKNAADVNWAEAALLAALIRSPSTYDPFKDAELASERRDIVFSRLVATDRLSQDEVDLYSQVPLPTEPNVPQPPNDYFVEDVKQLLLDDPRFGLGATPAARNRTVFEGGIRVFTTFDPEMQAKAIDARNQTLPNNQGDGTFPVTDPSTGQPAVDPSTGQLGFGTQAIASVEPATGAVRAIVGGPGFDRYQLNLATYLGTALPGRQPGSSMKTFVLAALFENGFIPQDSITTRGSCTFENPGSEPYKVRGGAGGGSIQRLTQSSANCGFVRLGQVVGTDAVVDMAKRLGVSSPLASIPSLPLGTKEITPLDMAAAYATFANDGLYNEPYFVERIEDREGKVLYQHEVRPQRVLDANARIDNGQPAGGKTGTTNDSADVWFVGYTPQLSTAIWMGVPFGRVSLTLAGLGGATGGRYPATTWGRYYSALFEGQPVVEFTEAEYDRRGKSVGKIPNEIGGSSSTVRRRTTTTTTPTSPTTTEVPATEPEPDTVPPATDPDDPGPTGAGE